MEEMIMKDSLKLSNAKKIAIVKILATTIIGLVPMWVAIKMLIPQTVFLGLFVFLSGVVWIWFKGKDGAEAYKRG